MQPNAKKPRQSTHSGAERRGIITLIDPSEMLVTPIEAEGLSLEWLVDHVRRPEGHLS